jgi:SAM-dependent methyltransferase
MMTRDSGNLYGSLGSSLCVTSPSYARAVPWFHAVAERHHEIQNPVSAEKIRLLGERIGLAQGQRVLDLACGRGGPAIVLASTFGCQIVGVERASEFASAARERVAAARLEHLIEVHQQDAAAFGLEREAWDAVLCLGASWIWGGLEGTVAELVPAVRRGGHLAVGDVYTRAADGADGANGEFVPLAETVRRFERAGPAVTILITASEQDWDAYESLHWASLEQWLADNADDPAGGEIRAQHEQWKWRYLEHGRDALGWAILGGRKR